MLRIIRILKRFRVFKRPSRRDLLLDLVFGSKKVTYARCFYSVLSNAELISLNSSPKPGCGILIL